MKKDIKYLIRKTAEYENKSIREYNSSKFLHKKAYWSAIARGITWAVPKLMHLGIFTQMVKQVHESSLSSEESSTHLKKIIENLSIIIQESENKPEFAPYKEECKKFLEICKKANIIKNKISSPNLEKDPKIVEILSKFIFYFDNILSQSGYVMGAIGKVKTIGQTVWDVTDWLIPTSSIFGASTVTQVEQSISWLTQQITLEIPKIKNQFKHLQGDINKLLEKYQTGEIDPEKDLPTTPPTGTTTTKPVAPAQPPKSEGLGFGDIKL